MKTTARFAQTHDGDSPTTQMTKSWRVRKLDLLIRSSRTLLDLLLIE